MTSKQKKSVPPKETVTTNFTTSNIPYFSPEYRAIKREVEKIRRLFV